MSSGGRGEGSDQPQLSMSLEEAMRTQRSIRRLKPDPVDDALILHLIELALKAPSGGNRQNVEFVVVKDPAVKRRLAQLNRIAWKAYSPLLRRAVKDRPAELRVADAVDWQADHYEDIPVLIVACLKWARRGAIVSGVPLPIPFWANIYYGSIFPAIQNLLLAARAAELGASLTVMPLWAGPVVRQALRLPLWVTPIAVVPLGWPKGRYGPTTRRAPGEVTHFDHYGNRPYQGSQVQTPRNQRI
jgi:nitroreductase